MLELLERDDEHDDERDNERDDWILRAPFYGVSTMRNVRAKLLAMIVSAAALGPVATSGCSSAPVPPPEPEPVATNEADYSTESVAGTVCAQATSRYMNSCMQGSGVVPANLTVAQVCRSTGNGTQTGLTPTNTIAAATDECKYWCDRCNGTTFAQDAASIASQFASTLTQIGVKWNQLPAGVRAAIDAFMNSLTTWLNSLPGAQLPGQNGRPVISPWLPGGPGQNNVANISQGIAFTGQLAITGFTCLAGILTAFASIQNIMNNCGISSAPDCTNYGYLNDSPWQLPGTLMCGVVGALSNSACATLTGNLLTSLQANPIFRATSAGCSAVQGCTKEALCTATRAACAFNAQYASQPAPGMTAAQGYRTDSWCCTNTNQILPEHMCVGANATIPGCQIISGTCGYPVPPGNQIPGVTPDPSYLPPNAPGRLASGVPATPTQVAPLLGANGQPVTVQTPNGNTVTCDLSCQGFRTLGAATWRQCYMAAQGQGGTCPPACGGAGQACCPNNVGPPCQGDATCQNNVCVPPPPCGAPGEPCCRNSTCPNGTGGQVECRNNVCTNCGAQGQSCCTQAQAACSATSMACISSTCQACGGQNQVCCPTNDNVHTSACGASLACNNASTCATVCVEGGGPSAAACLCAPETGAYQQMCAVGNYCTLTNGNSRGYCSTTPAACAAGVATSTCVCAPWSFGYVYCSPGQSCDNPGLSSACTGGTAIPACTMGGPAAGSVGCTCAWSTTNAAQPQFCPANWSCTATGCSPPAN
jgi:hypothetical protein